MVDRLHMTLDDIVNSRSRRERPRGRRPDDGARRNRRTDSAPVSYEAAIKFLLDNELAGSLIGSGGSSIRDMIDVTGASIHISSNTRRHPTTSDRTLFISGDAENVSLAAALVWEMIGQQTDARNNNLSDVPWDASAANASPGQYDEVDVHCQVIIPAASAGRVIGRGGNVLRSMESQGGVQASIDSAEDGELLQERIISLSGTVAGCMKFTAQLLEKLLEVEGGCQFVHSGSAYPMALMGNPGNEGSAPAHARNDRDRAGRSTGNSLSGKRSRAADDISLTVGNSRRVASRGDRGSRMGDGVAETLSATTTIELAVPNAYVGAILGIQGSKLAEIVSLSGARVRVSPKGEYVEGTTNRIVTIEGSPVCAQTAHTLIVHKVRQEMAEKKD